MNKKDLERLKFLEKEIRKIAEEEGLSTTEINFEVVPTQRVIEGMAYNFPINFSHWSHGRDYDRIRTIYEHTQQGIPYEQVWNFDTPRAFLVETNPFALQAVVIAHVYGHVDFFLNSRFTQHGRKFSDIAEEARNAASRFRKYEERYGSEEVEAVMDAGYSIQWHQHPDVFYEEPDEEMLRSRLIERARAKLLAGQRPRNLAERPLTPDQIAGLERWIKTLSTKTPPEPTFDLLGYTTKHSPLPLKPWMQDVLSVIRDQARALFPNTRTKMLNEGWATYWHVRIMRRLFEAGLLTPEEHGVFNTMHARVTASSKKRFNWYRIGLALYEDVKERWDKGRFGREYERCRDQYQKSHWDTSAGLGKQKIFEVRSLYSDGRAVAELFNDDFIRSQNLYIYGQVKNSNKIFDIITNNDAESVRQVLKRILGIHTPKITIQDGNLNGSNALLLRHHYTGQELDLAYCEKTLENIQHLWGRTVYLETVENKVPIVMQHDGQRFRKFQP